MTRAEQLNIIVTHLADNLKEYGVTKNKISQLLNQSMEYIKTQSIEDLRNGKKVDLIGFGAMTVKNVSARQYRNIQTGAMVPHPASKKVSMKPNKLLKDAVRKI